MAELKTRQEIAEQYKWRLEDIYPTDEAWEEEFQALTGKVESLEGLRETMTQSAEALAEALQQIDEASHQLERLYVYARMRRDEDNGNSKYQALSDRASGLNVKLSAALAYVNPLLLSMDEAVLRGYMKDCPALADYRFMLEDLLRSKAHVLDSEQERLLSLSGDFAGGAKDIFTMLNNADLDFGTVEYEGKSYPLSHGSYIALMQNQDRGLRKAVYQQFYGAFQQHINTITATYATNVKKDVFYTRARKYDDCLDRALFGDDVPRQVYTGLIDTVHKHLPTLHRFVELRRKLMGVDRLEMYDIYAPLVEDVDREYTYEEAVDLTTKGLAPLGEDYMEVFQSAFRDGWIDVYETKGKTSGAYSWGVYGVHPYVLLNHRGDLDSVFTLAHEMGHAMHTYYSNKNQPYPLSGYVIFVAEVASTVNEILMTKYLLRTTEDEKLKKYILNHYLDQFRTTVIRQTMFAEFEMISHQMAEQDQPLTWESLCGVYGDLNAKYHGPAMGDDRTISYEWARIPHFYNAFYVYKYATGFSSAVAIVNNLEKPGMLEKYRAFLSSGGSDYPIPLLEKAGVDFSTVVDKCMEEFAAALDEFERLMLGGK